MKVSELMILIIDTKKNWKIICNGVVLVTKRNYIFMKENKLKEVAQKEVITALDSLDGITIVVM